MQLRYICSLITTQGRHPRGEVGVCTHTGTVYCVRAIGSNNFLTLKLLKWQKRVDVDDLGILVGWLADIPCEC
jgi:hypothetical protein